jgi:broad specificity phosphatase PhoE
MKTTLSFFRHGQVHNPDRIFYGRLPRFGLSETGRQQARSAARALKDSRLATVFSSPLLRTRQTAGEVLSRHPHLRLRISKLLLEIATPFEGRPELEVDARRGDVYSGSPSPFEQPDDIYNRVRKFIRRARRIYPGQHIVAVTHGDVVSFTILGLNGQKLKAVQKASLQPFGISDGYPAPASITTLTFRTSSEDERPQVQYVRPY